jgi:hypothetical protein
VKLRLSIDGGVTYREIDGRLVTVSPNMKTLLDHLPPDDGPDDSIRLAVARSKPFHSSFVVVTSTP